MDFVIKKFNDLTNNELYEILKSRAEVFVKEQNITYIDADDIDYDSLHIFKIDNNRVVAYLRAYYKDKDTVKIGRVLTLEHGKGIGRELMETAIEEIPRIFTCKKFFLQAQKYVVPFYEKFGFKVISDEYLEVGILHLDMELSINIKNSINKE